MPELVLLLPPPIPVLPVVLLLRPGIMLPTVSPRLLAVSRTCSTTRLITLRAAGLLRAALTAVAVATVAAATGATRFATFFILRLRLVFAAPFRPAAERRADVERLAAERLLDELLLFFELPFFDELPPRFAELLRLDERLRDADFDERADDLLLRDDDFLEPLRDEEDLFLVAMRFLLMQTGNDGSCVA